jgi:sialic acid synthase SpsE
MKKTFIIAEIGINHGGKLEKAKKLIDSAVRAGVDAVKFQTYITEKRVKKNSPIFNILKECELSFKDFQTLKKYSDKKKVEFMSTPFDLESFKFLNEINVSKIKISSFDTVNSKFLKAMSAYNKEFIMSVGMSKLIEIKKAFKILKKNNKNKISLLHCVSSYPTLEKDANLNCMQTLRRNFNCAIGHSDHTNDIFVPFCAVVMGATIIEKHFMIDEKMKCVDKPVSITENQMSSLVKNIKRYEKTLGNNILGLRPTEKLTKGFRRFS